MRLSVSSSVTLEALVAWSDGFVLAEADELDLLRDDDAEFLMKG